MFHISFEFSIGKDRERDNEMGIVKRFKQAKKDKADAARVEAYHLQLKDDEFWRVSELVRRVVRDRVSYIYSELANVRLNDQNSDLYTVSRTDNVSQVLTITFNQVRHEIVFTKENGPTPVSRVIRVDVEHGKPIVVHRKFGNELGEFSDEKTISEVRDAVDALLKE